MNIKIDTTKESIEVLEGMLLNKDMQFDEYNAIQEAVQIMKAAQQSVQPTGGTCAACGEGNVVYDGCCINCGVPATSG